MNTIFSFNFFRLTCEVYLGLAFISLYTVKQGIGSRTYELLDITPKKEKK